MSQKSSQLKIAIIEDDDVNRSYLEMILKKMDIMPFVINDPFEAIDLMLKELPDILLLDIKLNCDLSGCDIARLMRKNKILKNIPIIVVSSFAIPREIREIKKESSCSKYVTKPFSMKTLIDVIETQLEEMVMSQETAFI